ncbi:MAG: hypothetical protein LBM96_13030 [Methanobrevibacter sp.]|jgi:hypothetical protein|nr:hypothetical protein [Candidatus Methanoflexus mossambicus]
MRDIVKLEKLIEDGKVVVKLVIPKNDGGVLIDLSPYRVQLNLFTIWKSQTINFLKNNLSPDNHFLKEFTDKVMTNRLNDAEIGVALLEGLIQEVKDENIQNNEKHLLMPIENVINIFDRFESIVLSLQTRRNSKKDSNKQPLLIKEELDLQYLLEALLLVYFDDVNPEESTPSKGGISSKIDFLIIDDKIAIETKYASKSLSNKKLVEELNDDIGKYFEHPNCETLLFFIWDENRHIKNHRRLEKDFTFKKDNKNVQTFIRP